MTYHYNPEPIVLRTIDADAGKHLNILWNAYRLERMPDDPPIPLEEDLEGWRHLPEDEIALVFLIWNSSRSAIAALGELWTMQTPENRHLAFFELFVLPEHRGNGLARRLLGILGSAAEQQERRLMLAETHSRAPAGAALMERLGAQPGLEAKVYQLRLDELDETVPSAWLAEGRRHAAAYQLGFWETRYPEEQIIAVAELFQIVNDEPRGALEIEDRKFTPEQLRQWEEHSLARGFERWTCYLSEKASGRFCGFTEVFWNPNRPHLLQQAFTGVYPDFRGMGFGRWLKAAMLEKVRRERPQVQLIRTGNADSNAPMRAINDALGFRPYQTSTVWQIETQAVLAYAAGEARNEGNAA